MDESILIFNDGYIKGRLICKDDNWYIGEWKYILDEFYTCTKTRKNIWFPWIAGTAEWLGLSEQEKAWAK